MSGAETPAHPWQRYGWLMGGVWLVFLAFPVAAAVDSGRSQPRIIGALVLFGLFAAIYIHGFISLARVGFEQAMVRTGVAHLAGLLAIVVGIHVLVGAPAAGGGPYLVSLAMFALPMWAAVCVTAFVVMGTLLITILSLIHI